MAPFTIVWSRYAAFDEDQASSVHPVMLLRLGAQRLLTVLTADRYVDGVGGSFLVRVAPGKWREVAAWYAGC